MQGKPQSELAGRGRRPDGLSPCNEGPISDMWRVAVNSDIQRPAGSRPLRGAVGQRVMPLVGPFRGTATPPHQRRTPRRAGRQAPVAQLDRAPDYEFGGREFESSGRANTTNSANTFRWRRRFDFVRGEFAKLRSRQRTPMSGRDSAQNLVHGLRMTGNVAICCGVRPLQQRDRRAARSWKSILGRLMPLVITRMNDP